MLDYILRPHWELFNAVRYDVDFSVADIIGQQAAVAFKEDLGAGIDIKPAWNGTLLSAESC